MEKYFETDEFRMTFRFDDSGMFRGIELEVKEDGLLPKVDFASVPKHQVSAWLDAFKSNVLGMIMQSPRVMKSVPTTKPIPDSGENPMFMAGSVALPQPGASISLRPPEIPPDTIQNARCLRCGGNVTLVKKCCGQRENWEGICNRCQRPVILTPEMAERR